ncbi:MAG: RNA polymerase sigma factor [Terriglobales bacterium]
MSTSDTTVGFSTLAATPAWGEQQFVGQLRAGSVDAFNYLIAVYHQPLYQFISRVMGGSDEAGDILQESFLKVFRSAAHFEGKSSLKTWLYQIALHEASNRRRWWRRHKQRELSLDDTDAGGMDWARRLPDGGESPLSLALRQEQRRQLQHALQRVPEPFHTVVVLREIEGFSYDEIAEILRVRPGTVKSRLMRGREMLRREWLHDREKSARVPAEPRSVESDL